MAISLYDDQEDFISEIRKVWKDNKRIVGYLPTGGGKCLGIDTPILMYSGEVKSVQDVVVGDLLMGPDSKPRLVKSLARGSENLYRVAPVKGDSYVVNESHILSLKRYGRHNNIVNIGIKDYISSSKTFRHEHKGWRCGVSFDEKQYCKYLPPYMLGVWLGDGTSLRPDITTPDPEIKGYLEGYCAEVGLKFKDITSGDRCKTYTLLHPVRGEGLTRSLRAHNLLGNKHIPLEYKTGSREQRMQLLAGLLDTDGHSHKSCIDFIFKQKALSDDVAYLCRSLGLAAYVTKCRKTATNTGAVGTYYRISVSGNCCEIPNKIKRKKGKVRRQIKNVLKTGITVEPIGVGDYYGFEIDGDHLFMLGDFTVTHNTRCAARIIEGFISRGLRVAFTVPRISLIKQTVDSFAELGILNVSVMQGQSDYNPGALVTVASLDTMIRRKKQVFDLVVIDEAHKKRKKLLEWMEEFPDERYLALTATPFPKWMGEYFTVMAKGKSMRWLIDNGRLAPYDVYAPDVPDTSACKVRMTEDGPDFTESALADIMDGAKIVGNVVQNWLRNGENRQTICLCVNVKHANHLANEFEREGISVSVVTAQTPIEERNDVIFPSFRNRITKILLSVDCLTEGANFPECSCLINARPTKSLCRYIQGLGRVLRFMEGKRAVIFDHSGSTLELGLPCDIEVDRLRSGDDGMSEVAPAQIEEREKAKPKKCSKCDYLKPAGVRTCPMCGFTARACEEVETREDIGLKQISGEDKKKSYTKEDKQRIYSELIGWQMQQRQKGKNISDGRVANLYRERVGVWPRSLGSKPAEPSPETLNYIKSNQIRFAKGKAKHENK